MEIIKVKEKKTLRIKHRYPEIFYAIRWDNSEKVFKEIKRRLASYYAVHRHGAALVIQYPDYWKISVRKAQESIDLKPLYVGDKDWLIFQSNSNGTHPKAAFTDTVFWTQFEQIDVEEI